VPPQLIDPPPLLEVCVDSLESALTAQAAGAGRVELCQALGDGGLTPTHGLLTETRARLSIPIAVMIRPRPADFCYSSDEFTVMKRDLAHARDHGADIIVLGLLTPDGRIDRERTTELIDLAWPLPVTFHRAFDMTRDPEEALADLLDLRVNRLLTSGQQPTALEGLDLITRLVRSAGPELTVVPGGGITEENLPTILTRSQAREFHVSASTTHPSQMIHRNPRVSMGRPAATPEYEWKTASATRIRRFCAIARNLPPQA
jgi:copper homeostasis protein